MGVLTQSVAVVVVTGGVRSLPLPPPPRQGRAEGILKAGGGDGAVAGIVH